VYQENELKNTLYVLFAVCCIAVLSSKTTLAQTNIREIVYIDPFLDHDLIGRAVKDEKTMKPLLYTLKRLSSEFKAHGIAVKIAPHKMNIEDGVEKAELEHSSLFLSFSLAKADKQCINIFYPKYEKKIYSQKESAPSVLSNELIDQLGNAEKETVALESKYNADSISKNLRTYKVENCIEVKESNSYLLKITSMPTIIIEFQLPNTDYVPAYLEKNEMIDRFDQAIVEAVNKYLSYPIGSPKRKGQ